MTPWQPSPPGPRSRQLVPYTSFVLVGVLLCSAWGPSRARAQESDYKELTTSGLEEYSRGNYAEALALFEEAHRRMPTARTLRAMGMACFELRQYLRAVGYLEQSLIASERPLTNELRDEVSSVLTRARMFIVRLEVTTTPADAELYVDGHAVKRDATGEVLLDPGEHDLVVKAAGFNRASRKASWLPGQKQRVEIALSPLPPEQSALKGDKSHEARLSKLTITAIASTGVAAAVAGVAVGMREKHARSLEENCGEDVMRNESACQDDLDSGQRWKRTAIGAGAVGAALLATSAALFVRDKKIERKLQRALQACTPSLGVELGMRCQASF